MILSTQPKLISNDEASLRFNLEQFENFGETTFQHVIYWMEIRPSTVPGPGMDRANSGGTGYSYR